MTKNFTLEELTSSSFAIKHNIDNTPSDAVIETIRKSAVSLEYVRKLCGDYPVVVTSGFRNEKVNKGVGGARNSAHMTGHAFDIKIMNGKSQVENAIYLKKKLKTFDQIISYKTFIHLGFGPLKRKQFIDRPK